MRVILKDCLYDGQRYKEVSFDYPDYDLCFYDETDYNDLGGRIFDAIHFNGRPSSVLENSVVIKY